MIIFIANGGPLWRPPFSRQNFVQSREAVQISLQHLGGGSLNTALLDNVQNENLLQATLIVIERVTNVHNSLPSYTAVAM